MHIKGLKRIIRTITFAAAVMLTASFATDSSSHIVTEEPWHPVAGAYLRAVFYANLKPLDWELIKNEYEGPIGEPGYQGKTVYALLAESDAYFKTSRADEIRKAISDKDSRALYKTSTGALTQYINYHLALAETKLARPGEALNDVQQAKRVYRALEEFIEQVDMPAYDLMGRSWLALTTSAGSAGVLGAGGVEPDKAEFTKAAEYITSYLDTNYENGGPQEGPRRSHNEAPGRAG